MFTVGRFGIRSWSEVFYLWCDGERTRCCLSETVTAVLYTTSVQTHWNLLWCSVTSLLSELLLWSNVVVRRGISPTMHLKFYLSGCRGAVSERSSAETTFSWVYLKTWSSDRHIVNNSCAFILKIMASCLYQLLFTVSSVLRLCKYFSGRVLTNFFLRSLWKWRKNPCFLWFYIEETYFWTSLFPVLWFHPGCAVSRWPYECAVVTSLEIKGSVCLSEFSVTPVDLMFTLSSAEPAGFSLNRCSCFFTHEL